jgi:hypothetical protein
MGFSGNVIKSIFDVLAVEQQLPPSVSPLQPSIRGLSVEKMRVIGEILRYITAKVPEHGVSLLQFS